MEQAIRDAITKLFKDRQLRCYVSKHTAERIVDRNIDLKELSKTLNGWQTTFAEFYLNVS